MFGTTITKVTARQVFSGKGHPAVEATVYTENGAPVQLNVQPLSVEPMKLPLLMMAEVHGGKGVMRAVENIEKSLTQL